MQRATLGCKLDGGQHKMGSYTHTDAEVIATTVARIPDSLGGIRMAIYVAELARAGLRARRRAALRAGGDQAQSTRRAVDDCGGWH